MLFYIWVAAMLAAIIAVPVAYKMSPESNSASGEDDNVLDEAGMEEFGAVDEPADPNAFGNEGFAAEPMADDAFEEFS